MKIFILFHFKTGPWGGGNQFLMGVRDYLREKGMLADTLSDADVVLLNSLPFEEEKLLIQLIIQKIRKPNLIIVHRIDGPISLYRGWGKIIDIAIGKLNQLLADGTIYQTEWSRHANQKYQRPRGRYSATIMNAPLAIFSPASMRENRTDGKKRLIAVSWSSNWNKGFEFYRFLDENLDFQRYSMTFVGRSPVIFRNIQQLPPMPPAQIAQLLPSYDIFVTASGNDPCSNALLEALASGLPAVARASGGHPEIVKNGGVLFSTNQELLAAIDTVSDHYQSYRDKISVSTMNGTAQEYATFFQRIYDDYRNRCYSPTSVTTASFVVFFIIFCIYKLYDRIGGIRRLLASRFSMLIQK